MNKLTGIILAGGKSTRMGTDKALLPFNGKKLIEYPIGLLKSVSDEILISSNNKNLKSYGYPVISDEISGCGPLGGMYSTLKFSTHPWSLVLSCDTPNITKELINRLIRHLGDYDGVVPVFQGKKEPLVALYNKSCIPAIRQNLDAGIFKLHFLLEKLNTCYVDVSDLVEKQPALFANLNSPVDLNLFSGMDAEHQT